jgi:oligopeptide transport system ATP-binding protein
MSPPVLLELRNLKVEFDTPEGPVAAVRGVSLDLQPGRCMAVVGESGSGKSQTFLACLGLLASNGRASGSACFEGQQLIGASEDQLNRLRGTKLVTIFQDPMNSLTPHVRIGEQVSEVLWAHGLADRSTARARAIEALRAVNIPEPERRYRDFPHEFSGGMRQRVAIAMALIAEPRLLVADEPTTALDVTVQAQILRLLRSARDQGLAIVLISHDLGVVAGVADSVAIMYAGRIVETGSVADLLATPAHPYTKALLDAMPMLSDTPGERLRAIEGQPPRPGERFTGCAFAARCMHRQADCEHVEPGLRVSSAGRLVACHFPLGDFGEA